MMPNLIVPKQVLRTLLKGVMLSFVLMMISPLTMAGGNEGEIPSPPPYDDDSRPPLDLDTNEIERGAIIGECGFKGRLPSGNPFNSDGHLTSTWSNLNIAQYRYSRSFADSNFRNPVCEKFLMMMIRRDHNGLDKFRDRCALRRADILAALENREGQNSDGGNFSFDGDFSFFDDDSSSDSGDSTACDDADALGGHTLFACRVLAFRDIKNSSSANKSAASEIKRECERAGVDMRPRMSAAQYQSYANSGVHYMGAYCGGGGPGGVVVLQQKNSWVSDLIKVGLPMMALNSANKRQAANAKLALQYNYDLGFPSAVTAGGNTPWNTGGAGGGAYYGGGGYGYSGHGGMCPQGYCHGNGGMVVGGGMPGMAPGMGQCGMPPYAAWNQGCAGGGGMPGMGIPGMMPGMAGGGAGMMPGPYGTAGGGNGWNNGLGRGPGGVGGSMGGVPGLIHGGGGAGGMPGPYGTAGGGNGWGQPNNGMGQWGPGGLYGQTPFYGGGASPMAAQQAAMMAQQMQDYAKQIQRQAELAQKAESQYMSDLNSLYKVYGKSSQSYMAAQQAQYSLGGLQQSQMGMQGMTGYQSMYQGSYMGTGMGTYYPPYASPAPSRGLSVGFGLNYRK